MGILRNYRLIITALIIGIFATYLIINSENFKPLLDVNISLLIVIVLANIAVVFINGLFIKSILKPFRKFISASEAFYVSIISSIGNFFATAGTGFGVRAVYLKKRHGLSYGEFVSTLSGNYLLVFLLNSFVGLTALYLLRDELNSQYVVLSIAFGVMFIASLLILLDIIKFPAFKSKLAKGSRIANGLRVVANGWNKITNNKKLMLDLLYLTTINFILSVLIYWTIIHALHLTISLPALLLFSVLGSLSIFINITPANLGVKEVAYLFSSGILDFSVAEILLIALIERGAQFAVLLILWIFLSITRTKEKLLNNHPGTNN